MGAQRVRALSTATTVVARNMNKNLKLFVAAERGAGWRDAATGSRAQPIGGGAPARSCAPVVVARERRVIPALLRFVFHSHTDYYTLF